MLDNINYPAKFEHKPTPLYGLAPKGMGTGQVESLLSYVLSLAHSHLLSPRRLVLDILSPLSRENNTFSTFGRSLLTNSGREMLGGTMLVRDWLNALSLGTGRTDLVNTTLYRFRHHITGEKLLSNQLRHCQSCFENDLKEGYYPYRRLLWHINEVTCCPIHRTRLTASACGLPKHEHLHTGQRMSHPSVCRLCGSIGHKCGVLQFEVADPPEIWKAIEYEKLLQGVALVTAVDPSHVKCAVQSHADQTVRGVAGIAARSGLQKSVLWTWLNRPTARFSLGGFARIAAAEGWSLFGLLTADLTPVAESVRIDVARCRPHLRHVGADAIEARLADALVDPISLNAIACDLGVSRRLLSTKYGELSKAVTRNLAVRRSEATKSTRQQAIKDAMTILLKLWAAGLPATLRNARNVSTHSWFPSALRSKVFSVLRNEFCDQNLNSVTRLKFDPEMVDNIERCRLDIREFITGAAKTHKRLS